MNCYENTICQRIKTIAAESENYINLIYDAPCIYTRNMLLYQLSVHDSHLLSEIETKGINIEGLFIGIEPYEINYFFGLSASLKQRYFKIVEGIENIITSHVR